ncbi:facilitated trehalose transporter Tret1-like [Athalia rosae]|uniref:facilitated trehalose transporter Tret1-like n=1 Tax=Athalia rosae TaxID=37344 RepID=UPI0020337180|nr:facilitated trehalose transporter Tret1-like [Athalia rosae]XP_012250739.2 facilitated trehalose transporter Tret1-like [Athalia rosae]XP_048507467.1 facilitated trehalose transporter Tret1-like [Athalia rosae]
MVNKDSEKGQYASPEGSHYWEYLTTFCCTIIMLCIGNVVGWNSPSLGKLLAPDSPITLTASDASTMAAAVSMGHTFAPPLTMVMIDRLGRKMSLVITGVPLIICWGLIIVANHVYILSAARFIGGFSLGLGFCICPIYLGEVVSPKLRGSMGMLISIMFNSGVLFMMLVVPYVTIKASAGLCMGLVIVFLVCFSFMPESPYFLVMVGRDEEAEAVLEKLRGKTDVSEELELIKLTLTQRGRSLEESDTASGKRASSTPRKLDALRQICTVRGNRKALFIILIFVCSHHFGGFITITIYGHVVFTAMGVPIDSHICTTIVALLQSVSTVVATFLIDRLGRKPLLAVSGTISGICLVVISGYFYAMEYMDIDVSDYVMIPFSAVIVLVVAANSGVMPIQNVILSEIFDTDIKAVATCIFGVISGIISIITVKYYLMMATSWGFGQSVPFIICAIATWLCTGLLMWILPETRGKTFLQIQKDLNA